MFANFLLGKTTPNLFKLISYYWKFTPRNSGLLSGLIASGVFIIVFRLLEPWPIKWVFDHIIAPHTPENSTGMDSSSFLILAALMVIVIAGLRLLSTLAHTQITQTMSVKLFQKLRNGVFCHIQLLPIIAHENTVQKYSNLNNDIKQIQDSLSRHVLPFISTLVTLGSMLVVLLIINWRLTLFAILTVPAAWFLTLKIAQMFQKIKYKKNLEPLPLLLGPPSNASNIIDNIPILTQIQPINDFQKESVTASSQKIIHYFRSIKSKIRVEATSDILLTIATALVLWYGAVQIVDNTLTAGELLIFFAYLHFSFKPLRKFSSVHRRLLSADQLSQKIFHTLENDKLVQEVPNAIPFFSFQGAVRFENVTVSNEYGDKVLNDFNFTVQPGQLVALVAPTGSNKTAFIGLLLRLINSHEGRVLIDGYDIRSYSIECVQSQISLVMQENVLFNASIRDNIAFDINHTTPADVEIAARIVNAHKFIIELPQGYDTKLSEEWNRLTIIQRLKIVLARTILHNNPIVIMDDLISKLNHDEQNEITLILQKLSQNRSTFFITHDARQSVCADLILYIENGGIKELGTHEELLCAGGPYSKLFEIQSNINSGLTTWVNQVAHQA